MFLNFFIAQYLANTLWHNFKQRNAFLPDINLIFNQQSTQLRSAKPNNLLCPASPIIFKISMERLEQFGEY